MDRLIIDPAIARINIIDPGGIFGAARRGDEGWMKDRLDNRQGTYFWRGIDGTMNKGIADRFRNERTR